MHRKQENNKKHKKHEKSSNLHYFYLTTSALIDSCPIPKIHIQSKKDNSNVLVIHAKASMKMSEYLKKSNIHMEYYHAEKMIDCIGRQLQILENNDMGIPIFNLDDITVFFIKKMKTSQFTGVDSDSDERSDERSDDDDGDTSNNNILYDNKYSIYFAITNDEKICTFKDGNIVDPDASIDTITKPSASLLTDNSHQQIVISTPLNTEFASYQKNKTFMSPEYETFMKVKKIPYDIHFKSGYYSFGLLCIYCILTKKPVSFDKTQQDDKEIEPEIEDCLISKTRDNGKGGGHEGTLSNMSILKYLRSIKNTKIYWFLIRVLKENPSERRYICV